MSHDEEGKAQDQKAREDRDRRSALFEFRLSAHLRFVPDKAVFVPAGSRVAPITIQLIPPQENKRAQAAD